MNLATDIADFEDLTERIRSERCAAFVGAGMSVSEEPPKSGVEYPECLAWHMLDVVTDPVHEDFDDTVEWLGDDFDPDAFDIDEINDMLAKLR